MLAVLCAFGLAVVCALTLVAAANARTTGCKTRACEQRVRVKWQRLTVAPYAVILDRIRACESGSNYRAVSRSGQYRGAYQFDVGTWLTVGGRGDPAAATPLEQDYRAALLYKRRGAQPWPVCGYR